MLYPTHVAGGMAAGLLIMHGNAGVTETLIVTLTTGTAALLPDLDSPRSYIGSRVPLISIATRITFGHRGSLHSLLAAAVWIMLLTAGLKALGLSYNGIILNSFLVGYLSHLFLDMLTPKGIPLLWPLKIKISLPLVQTGGIAEKLILFPALFGCLLFQLIN